MTENKQHIKLVTHDNRKALKTSRKIRVRAKATAAFLYLPETYVLRLKTKNGTLNISGDDILEMIMEETHEQP